MRKVIVSLAPVRAGDAVDANALAEDVKKSVDAGAAMCHLHCRKPDGNLTADISYMEECFEAILKKTDGEAVYRNSFDDIRYCASEVYKRGILPETEVFDIGMIHNMKLVEKEQPFAEPKLFNLVFGHKGGMQATPEMLSAFPSFVPQDALWGVTHFGRDNWTFLAAAIAMGATVVRIGFEDSAYLEEGKSAEYNYQLVEKIVALIRAMGLDAATLQEAREILHLKKR